MCGNFNCGDFPEYNICPLCEWEDDKSQLNNPDESGGANWLSLNQAKENWKKYGVVMTEKDEAEATAFYKAHTAPDGTWID